MPDRTNSFHRRQFFGSLIATTGATSMLVTRDADGQTPTSASSLPVYDFRDDSAAFSADRVAKSACQFCNCNCRLLVQLKNDRIIDIRGDTDDPVQAGSLCVKASMMTELVYNSRRLTTPMKRVAGAKGDPSSKFEAITWNEALEEIAKRFLSLRDAGQAHTIANRTTGRMPRGSGSVISRFFQLLGSPNDTDVGPVCNDAGGNALAWTFGLGNFTNGYGVDESTGNEDLGSAKFILMLGTNQAETHPVTFAHVLREREKTRAPLVVVDPRETPTTSFADLWLAPKPHTDLALILGMLHHVITEELFDRVFVDRWVLGFRELRHHVVKNNYTVEWAANVCDVSAEDIRYMATQYATQKPAAIYCNAGISHQLGAFDTYRAIAMLAAITGNVGVPGGGCNFMHNTWPGGLDLPPVKSPLPKRKASLPVGPDYFAESILESRPYGLRAIVTQGNPLLASANTNRVKRAFEQLEFYVYTGLFKEEAAYYADILLPVTSGLEMETVYMRRDDRAIRWQEQAVPRVGESKPDWQIWIELAHTMERLDKTSPKGYWANEFPLQWLEYENLWQTFVDHTPGMGGMTRERMIARSQPLRWPCPSVDHPGVSTLYMDHPSWYQAAESLHPGNRGKRFLTPSGKVEIYTEAMNGMLAPTGHSALPHYYTHPEVTGEHPTIRFSNKMVTNPIHPHALTRVAAIGQHDTIERSEFPLMGIIGRPSVVHFAGVTQWTYTGKQMNGERLIQIHPDVAEARNIKNGDTITVESPRGKILGTALLWKGIRRDCVFVPNTYGPTQEVGDEFGLARYEAANTLVDDAFYDNLSGQQAYKCFACRISPA